VAIQITVLFALNEVENVEALHRSIQKEAIDRIVLIIDELKGDGQPAQQEELQMRPIDA